ncbi:MAG TPA: hypothetical protein VG758_18425 [Hyphomicrobiaceae bacterium]|jgi:hypothetical protein|nr:hypothetical protein [Hyphomicrobiaceae bacterium]
MRAAADKSFALLKRNPRHPSLHLKRGGVSGTRAGRRHRALAVEVKDGLLWFWIGTHEDYERLTAE